MSEQTIQKNTNYWRQWFHWQDADAFLPTQQSSRGWR
jgi:hypothetical protein